MKKITRNSMLLLLAIFSLMACKKEETVDPTPIVPVDQSLIITGSSGKYIILSPSTGEIKAEVAPDVIFLEKWALGYQSQKAVITSKEPGGSGTKVIFTCDRETGDNLFQVTSENDWDVFDIDVSPVGSNIVFSAQDVDALYDDQIHRINEDATGYQQLTFKDEGVECPTKIATKMVFAFMPAWSPSGAYIAFNGKLREIVENHPHDAVMIMDANGNNKTVLYSEAKEEANFQDICWTRDGKFLIWLQGGGNNYLVKVLNVLTLDMVDITANLTVNGLQPTNLWTSPNEDRIVFNKYEPGGGDLYEISFKITDTDHFQIDGSYSILAAQQNKGLGFGVPDWQLWTNIN